jgi:hypothetical protein
LFEAFELVQARQAEITRALDAAHIEYALSGSNATYAWIASLDEAAERAYRNVEFIVRPGDDSRVISVLQYLKADIECKPDRTLFRYKPGKKDRWCDCMFLSGTLLAQECTVPNIKTELVSDAQVLSLPILVRFQLERWLLDDKVDLRDMMGVGLIDYSWLERLPVQLSMRLKELLDDPDG